MKNVEIGGRKEIKTPSHVLLAKGLDHRADVLGLQLEGLAQRTRSPPRRRARTSP